MESEQYYQNLIKQQQEQLDQLSDEIAQLTENKKNLEHAIDDTRSEYAYQYKLEAESLRKALNALDRESEDYDGKVDGILAQLEAIGYWIDYCGHPDGITKLVS